VRIPRRALAVAAALLAVACVDQDFEKPGSREAELALVDHVRRELAAGRWDYETGLELIAAGEEALGAEVLDAATKRLRAATARCAALASCDTTLLQTSMESLLRWRPPQRDLPTVPELAGVGDRASPARESAVPGGAAGNLMEMIPRNEHVQAAIAEWLTWRRDELADARRHYQFLRESMQPLYEEAGLPEALLFGQLATESAGKVHAYSSAGAVGPLQFMSKTAMHYGLTMVDGFDTRLDPSASTRANASYVRRHLAAFGGDLGLVIAAYNAGETRLRKLARRYPGRTFWDDEIFHSLPLETRRHVPRVFAAAILFAEPERYGLATSPEGYPMSRLPLQEPLAVDELAICLGDEGNPHGWFRTLRNLNPQHDPAKTLPAGTEVSVPASLVAVYAQRCTGPSPWLALARELHAADYPRRR
jgi:membrane-bound lytic murein transglycosylase D